MTMTVEKLEGKIRNLFTEKKNRYHSVTFSALSEMLGVKENIKSLEKVCRSLEAEGAIFIDKGAVKSLSHYNMIAGTVRISVSGDGRVIPSVEPKSPVFVDYSDTADALNGDFVLVRVSKIGRRGRSYGTVVKVLKRKHGHIVGEVKKLGEHLFVVPLSDYRLPDISLPSKDSKNLRQGQLVVVKPLSRKKSVFAIEGELIKIIGEKGGSATDTKIIIEKYGFTDEFLENVLNEAEGLECSIDEEIKKREDFRLLPTVTVDGEKARDFDDAVSIEIKENQDFRLYVHIADVSFFVKSGGSIDSEAWSRGTSIYFPDYWIPMLPMRLSSDLCSLNQRVDKLTVTAVMDIDKAGSITDYRLSESVIRSDERMTYTDFQKVLDGDDEDILDRYRDYADSFKLMEKLCIILREKRRQRGSLDFDLPEPEFILDATGDIVDIIKSQRLTSHRIIEEFMIAANETVASHIFKTSLPSIYRIHEAPDKDRINEFNEFIKDLGIDIKPIGKINPKNFQNVLKSVQGLEIEHLVSTILLRSLKHAVYTTRPEGHFGLASKHYTHFTSPIRRYPDLVVHRILKRLLKNGNSGKKLKRNAEDLKKTSIRCSETERKAEEAEREVLNRKKLEFLKAHSGEIFSGIISGVAEFGFFVEIEGYYVDGLVRMHSLRNDYYIYEADKHQIRGRRSGMIFRIGDKVKVLAEEVYPERGEMDLKPILERSDSGEKRQSGKGKSEKRRKDRKNGKRGR